jgi:hypothetical protein
MFLVQSQPLAADFLCVPIYYAGSRSGIRTKSFKEELDDIADAANKRIPVMSLVGDRNKTSDYRHKISGKSCQQQKYPDIDRLETILTKLNAPGSEYGKPLPVSDPLHLIENFRPRTVTYDLAVPSQRN